VIAQRRKVWAGYNAQAAATADQVVVAAEVTATTNDQTQFVPMATAVKENLADAGNADAVGCSWLMPGTGAPPTQRPMSAPTCSSQLARRMAQS